MPKLKPARSGSTLAMSCKQHAQGTASAASAWVCVPSIRGVALVVALASSGSCSAQSPHQEIPVDAANETGQAVVQTASLAGSSVSKPRAPRMTYYVRTDGGDASQCTGDTDAAYPGSGTGRACAWSHPFHALSPDGTLRIDGGDTLLIGTGSYMIGPDAPGALGCVGRKCGLPPIPSGPSDNARTRVLGKSCSSKPQLWGSGGINSVVNLEGSSNVEIGCLEITDRDDCVHAHSDLAAKCRDGGNWARSGVLARRSANVRLHDLDIHGLAHSGINAGGLGDWIVERVRIIANGRAGWDGNVGEQGSANAGSMTLREIEIGWNGCGERWQDRTPWACWAQKTGGYGDGFGTRSTGGRWLIEDAHIHHNTSDGLDLLYLDGADSTWVMIRRLHAVANAGNQVKVRGSATIENSVIVGHCGYFKGKHFMVDGDLCRAGGNAVQLALTPTASVNIRHNTITGEGGALIGAVKGGGNARVHVQNNVMVGFPAFHKRGILTDVFYADDAVATLRWTGNLVWNVKGGECPAGSICGRDPKLANMSLASFDAQPLAGSPVLGQVPTPGGIGRDFRGRPRPMDGPSAIGAIELPTR